MCSPSSAGSDHPFTGGSKSSGLPKNHVTVGSLANGLPGASDVANEFKGIPQTGTTLGWPSAPVTLTEYIDLQCPICQEFETQVFPDILTKYIRTKKVKVVMKAWAFIGPDSIRAQKVALAAAKQNKLFDFTALLYDNQGTENTGWATDQMLYNIAASIPGLKIDPLFTERNSAAVANEAKQSRDGRGHAEGQRHAHDLPHEAARHDRRGADHERDRRGDARAVPERRALVRK